MTTPTVSLHFTIQQGATFRARFQRFQVPVDVVLRGTTLIYKGTGKPVPDADRVPTDYTGCSARMELRKKVTDPQVLLVFSTTPEEGQGSITLGADGQVQLYLSHTQTSAINWKEAIGQMEVTFGNGDVERQFEIGFCVDPEGTRGG